MQHRHGHVAWKRRTYSMGIECMALDMQHGNGTCSLDMDTHRGHWHAWWTWACIVDMDMQHGQVRFLFMCYMLQYTLRVLVNAACLCPCCMPISTLHAPVHAACPPACSGPCNMDMEMKQGRGHSAGTWTFSRDVEIQQGRGHAA